jgi:hypothetical protein
MGTKLLRAITREPWMTRGGSLIGAKWPALLARTTTVLKCIDCLVDALR